MSRVSRLPTECPLHAARHGPCDHTNRCEDDGSNGPQNDDELDKRGVDVVIEKSGADPPVPIGYRDHALQLWLRVRIRRALHEYVDERDMRSRHALTVSLAVGQSGRGFIALSLGPDEL